MTVTRRRFLHLAAGAGAFEAALRKAHAETYPARPARIISGFPPGGISDTYARLVGQYLSEHLGQQFIVENRPGAGGNLAAETVAKSEPDGYTLLLTTSADAWNATLYKNLNYNYVGDFTPIATVSRGAGILVVHPSLPDKTIGEFIADAKAHPGKMSVASAGVGSAPYMFWELFRSMSGVDMLHVPYHGAGPAVVDLLAGQVQSYFGSFASSIEYVRAGRLRALAVTSTRRSSLAPELPTMIEAGLPGFDVRAWFGVLAPARTPREIVQKLNAEINRGLNEPATRSRLAADGVELAGGTPAEFDAFIRAEMARWPKIIKAPD